MSVLWRPTTLVTGAVPPARAGDCGERQRTMTIPHFTYDTIEHGQRLGTLVHEITPAFVADYCRATGDAHAWHGQGAPPFGTPIAPTAMANIFSILVFGIPGTHRPSGDLHARQEYEFLAPIRVGETITTTGFLVEKYTRKGRKWVVFDTHSTDTAHRLVARCRVTLVIPE
jgi:acyl dehydratase